MHMPGRTLESGGGYRFGFNGQEKIDEIAGSGSRLDFGARIHDARLGKWLSIDPLQGKYPSLSTYNFVANNPIFFIDPDGKRYIGVNVANAKRFVTTIQNTFVDPNLKAFFKLQSENSTYLAEVNMQKLEGVLKNIKDAGVKALARQYAYACSPGLDIYVQVASSDEETIHPKMAAGLNKMNPEEKEFSSKDIANEKGSWASYKDGWSDAYILVTGKTEVDVVNNVSGVKSKDVATIEENAAHETAEVMLRWFMQPGFQYMGPIQMSNAVRRAMGLDSYRPGTDHAFRSNEDGTILHEFSEGMPESIANELPTIYKDGSKVKRGSSSSNIKQYFVEKINTNLPTDKYQR